MKSLLLEVRYEDAGHEAYAVWSFAGLIVPMSH